MHESQYDDDDEDSTYVNEQDIEETKEIYTWFDGAEECENAGYETDDLDDIPEAPPVGFTELVPFDVSLPMHPTIIERTTDEYWRGDNPGIEMWKQWDPEFIVAGMMNGIFDFDLNDFYQENQKEKRKKAPKAPIKNDNRRTPDQAVTPAGPDNQTSSDSSDDSALIDTTTHKNDTPEDPPDNTTTQGQQTNLELHFNSVTLQEPVIEYIDDEHVLEFDIDETLPAENNPENVARMPVRYEYGEPEECENEFKDAARNLCLLSPTLREQSETNDNHMEEQTNVSLTRSPSRKTGLAKNDDDYHGNEHLNNYEKRK